MLREMAALRRCSIEELIRDELRLSSVFESIGSLRERHLTLIEHSTAEAHG
jgi:hypothetical protein